MSNLGTESPETYESVTVLAKAYEKVRLVVGRVLNRTFSYIQYRFGGFFVGFGVGVLCVLTLRLPLFPYGIANDKILAIVQAVAGAMIGAGLAGVLARALIAKNDVQTRQTVARVIRAPTNKLNDLALALEKWAPLPQTATPKPADIVTSLDECEKLAKHALTRLELLSTSHTQISEGRGVAIVDATIALNDFLAGDLIEAKLIAHHARQIIPSEGGWLQMNIRGGVAEYRWDTAVRELLLPAIALLETTLDDLGFPLRSIRGRYLEDHLAGGLSLSTRSAPDKDALSGYA